MCNYVITQKRFKIFQVKKSGEPNNLLKKITEQIIHKKQRTNVNQALIVMKTYQYIRLILTKEA